MVGQWQDGFQESRPPSEVSLIESDPPEPPEPEPEPEPPQTPPEPTEVKISAEASKSLFVSKLCCFASLNVNRFLELKPGELKTKGIMGHNRTFHLHEYSYYEGKHLKGTSVLTCLCTSKGCTGRLYLNEIRKTYQVRSHDHEPFDQGAD